MPDLPQELAQQLAIDPRLMSRRCFLRFSVGGVSLAWLLPLPGCSQDPVADERPPVLWLETGVCTGCACSLLGSDAPPSESLLPDLRLGFQETLMGDFGARAIDGLLAMAASRAGQFILVVDGAVPRGPASPMTILGEGSDGSELSAEALLATLAAQAAQVVALGTCACFGGIPGSGPGMGVQVSVAEIIGKCPMRIPGCPPNPYWIAGALTALLRGDTIELDPLGRPTAFFGQTVHARCPRLPAFTAKEFASAPGDPVRCLLEVGCKGTMAMGDCPSRLWQGRSYCIKANHPCIGCTTPGFLDARPTVDGKAVGAEGAATTPFAKPVEVLP